MTNSFQPQYMLGAESVCHSQVYSHCTLSYLRMRHRLRAPLINYTAYRQQQQQ